MNHLNIYEAFREIENLRKLVDRYHAELRRKDEIISGLKKYIIENIKKEEVEFNEQRKQNIS